MTYKALNGLGPGYLKERLHPYVPACPLRSAALLREPSVKDIRRRQLQMILSPGRMEDIEELTTEELAELQSEQQKVLAEEDSTEEEDREEVSRDVVQSVMKKWNECQDFFEKHHPNITVTNRVLTLMNDNVVSHLRRVMQRRKKQVTVDRFFTKIDPAAKAEETPERDLPSVLMKACMTRYNRLSTMECRAFVSFGASMLDKTKTLQPSYGGIVPFAEIVSKEGNNVGLGQDSYHNLREVLQLKLQQRRTREELVSQGIMPRSKHGQAAWVLHYIIKGSIITQRRKKCMEVVVRSSFNVLSCYTGAVREKGEEEGGWTERNRLRESAGKEKS
ncbi:Myocardin-related transcription factor B [Varanus komodoensis]|nr:Myocardin-related transcription factor B [Varanus komodoensis]